MKKIAILMVFAVLMLSACGKISGADNSSNTEGVNVQNQTGKQDIPENEAVFKGMEEIIKASGHPKEAASYLAENIGKAGTKTADKMILKYKDYLMAFINSEKIDWNKIEKLNEYYSYEKGLEKDKINDADLKAYYEGFIDAGCKFISLEGMLTPIVDYEWLSRYNSYLSPDVAAFISLNAVESNQIAAEDGGLVITWDQLSERVYGAEKYLSDYPDSALKDDAAELYQKYLEFYMIGLNNTPIVDDYATGVVRKDVLKSYERFIEKYPDSATAIIIGAYRDYLNSIGNIVPYNDNEKSDLFFEKVNELKDDAIERISTAS